MVTSRGESGEGPPTRFAEGPPSLQEQGSTLPLMAVMEIQRTLGGLTQSVETLRESQRHIQTQLDGVAQKVASAQTVAWVVGIGVMAVIGFVGWLVTNAIALLPSLLNTAR